MFDGLCSVYSRFLVHNTGGVAKILELFYVRSPVSHGAARVVADDLEARW